MKEALLFIVALKKEQNYLLISNENIHKDRFAL